MMTEQLKCTSPTAMTERPGAPSGVAVFMSAHSKNPYITPGIDFSSGKGVVRGRRVQQLKFALVPRHPHHTHALPLFIRTECLLV